MNDFINIERDDLGDLLQAAARASRLGLYIEYGFTLLAIAVGLGAGLYVTGKVSRQVGGEPAEIAAVMEQIARGNLDFKLEGGSGVRASVGSMLQSLRENREWTRRQDWLKTGIARIGESVSGGPDIQPWPRTPQRRSPGISMPRWRPSMWKETAS